MNTQSFAAWSQLGHTLVSGVACLVLSAGVAQAQSAASPIHVTASFSVLADLVQQIGGSNVQVDVLVSAGGDAHTFAPKPAQVKQVGRAQVVFMNGMGFDGWMPRLLKAAAFKGHTVTASEGVTPVLAASEDEHHHTHAHGKPAQVNDPHVWQDPKQAQIYVQNIANGLCQVDATACAQYKANAVHYQQQLDQLDQEIRQAWQAVPAIQRLVITSHDAFGYYAHAYGVRFLAPQGISTESEPSAQGVSRLIRQIRREKAQALFVENIADPRLLEQIARETQTQVSPQRLYSDSLAASGPASTYLGMMRHNTQALLAAVRDR